MRRRWSPIAVWLLVLVFAQACLGQPSSPLPTPSATTSPAAGSTSLSGAPTAQATTPTASTRNTATATPANDQPTPTGRPEPQPAAQPTATSPRLGIDPPGTPTRPSPTPTASALPTGREATIAQVQGTGNRSPLLVQTVRVVNAIVTADFQELPARGFFIQERNPSSQEASTGIFVYQGERATPDVKLGDEVTVVGVVRETFGRTELDISLAASGVTVVSSGNALPPPVELRPPPRSADAAIYFERYEGMLVTVPTAVVVGPTTRFGEFVVVRADTGVKRLFGGDPQGAGWRIAVDDASGVRYDVAVGDIVDGIVGPLDFTFGAFKVQHLPEPRLVITPLARINPSFPGASENEFTIASFNLENFFDPFDTPNKQDPCDRDSHGVPCAERVTPADYALKIIKAGQAIRNVLGAPTLVAVQEVESLDVLSTLADSPELAPLGYGAVLLEGVDPRGIDVGLLYRRDRVTIEHVSQRNACTTTNYGFTDLDARCSSRGDGIVDGYLLSARPPLVVSLTVARDGEAFPMTLIITHFKSKSGTDPEGKEFVSRRTAEAQLVAAAVNDLLAADPNAAIAVVGDFNDFADSPPLLALTSTAPLQNLTPQVPQADRYSYIYNGLSQVLDHVLVTARLRPLLIRVTFVHLDADYPQSLAGQPTPNHVSDHDPPLVRFRFP